MQKDARRDVNAEKREAQGELDQKRQKKEKAAQGRGKGRGRGRGGRGRKSQEETPEVEENVPGKYADEAVAASTEQGMQRLRSQRELEAGCTYGPAKLLINALANIKIRSWEADGGDDEGDGSAADEVPKASPMQFNEIAHS